MIPSRTSQVRFSPSPCFSRHSTTRTLCEIVLETREGFSRFSANSPAWPKGVCPRSWPRAMASTRSSFSRRALAMVLAFWDTSRVWVSLVR